MPSSCDSNKASNDSFTVDAPTYVLLGEKDQIIVNEIAPKASWVDWKSTDPKIIEVPPFTKPHTLAIKGTSLGTTDITVSINGGTVTTTINVIRAAIDPVAPWYQDGTTGDLQKIEVTGERLNQIPNPSAIVIPPQGTEPGDTTVVRVFLTVFLPRHLTPSPDAPFIVWKVAPDGNGGGETRFYGEHPGDSQPDLSNGTMGWGNSVRLYGVTAGRILLTAYLDPGGGRALVKIDQYEALVTPERDIPYRVQLASHAVSPADALKAITIANSFLWQAGVKLVPDQNNFIAQGAVADGNGIYSLSVPPADLAIHLKDGPRTQQLLRANAVKNVWNLVFVDSILDVNDKDTAFGAAASTPGALRLSGTDLKNYSVTLNYRMDLQDKIGSPHTMQLGGKQGADSSVNFFGAFIDATYYVDLTHLGKTIVHETGHYLGLQHRNTPVDERRPFRPGQQFNNLIPSKVWDGLDTFGDRNIMDGNSDANGLFLDPKKYQPYDFDLIQTMVAHGLL